MADMNETLIYFLNNLRNQEKILQWFKLQCSYHIAILYYLNWIKILEKYDVIC